MAVEAVEVEVGFDRRGGSEFAQGTHVVAREYQVGFFFLFFFFFLASRDIGRVLMSFRFGISVWTPSPNSRLDAY